jgi:hypothetical protein
LQAVSIQSGDGIEPVAHHFIFLTRIKNGAHRCDTPRFIFFIAT